MSEWFATSPLGLGDERSAPLLRVSVRESSAYE